MTNVEITAILTQNIVIFDTAYQEWKLYIIDNQYITLEILENKALIEQLYVLQNYRFPYPLIQQIGQMGITDETFLNTLQRLKFDDTIKETEKILLIPAFILSIVDVLIHKKTADRNRQH